MTPLVQKRQASQSTNAHWHGVLGLAEVSVLSDWPQPGLAVADLPVMNVGDRLFLYLESRLAKALAMKARNWKRLGPCVG